MVHSLPIQKILKVTEIGLHKSIFWKKSWGVTWPIGVYFIYLKHGKMWYCNIFFFIVVTLQHKMLGNRVKVVNLRLKNLEI